MSLGDRIPIEPMSEARWERVEDALFAELDARSGVSSAPPQRRRRPGWAIGAMVAFAAAAAGALVVWLAAGPAEAPQGPSMYSSRIVTDEDATRATIGDVSLQVAGASALTVVGSDAQGWVVTLEEGSADFAVPPRRERPPFVVHAADLRVEVVGTRFTVARHGGAVSVRVSEGVVRVTGPDAAVELRAGEGWPAVVPADHAADPSQAVVAPPPAGDDSATDSASEARRDEDVPSSSSSPSARAVFERAQSLEAADPARAVALYARLARRGGPWAANALYAQARLELERGRPAEARRLSRRYLARHPEGPNAADARSLLVRTAPE